MDHPIVTVILPVYNIEKYLEKAVNSILSQTLTNWEMYLVDDGSIDSSGKLCDQLALGDSRIHVLHQENQGAASARNEAIDLANGKYLFFMDGDDWATRDMLYDLVCLAEHYYLDAWAGQPVDNRGRRLASINIKMLQPDEMKADTPERECAQLVVAGFYIETYYTDSEYYIQKQCVPARVYGDKYEFREHAHELFDCNLLYTPWNKLYLTSYIRENNIRFPDMHWDDFPFNLEVIRNVERVAVSDHAYYHFIRKRSDSESEKYNENLYIEREAENQKLLDLYDGWVGEQTTLMLQERTAYQELLPEVSGEEASEYTGDGESQEQQTYELISKEELAIEKGENSPIDSSFSEAKEFLARRYLERVIGCVENITNPQCTLNRKDKRNQIREMIKNDSVRMALKEAKPRSFYMKLMLVPVRMKSISLTMLEGSIISGVKAKNGKLFAKLKENR